jgi:uncharacterized membrane protein YhiD involved in acid resistance
MPTDLFGGHERIDLSQKADEERWSEVRHRAQEAVRKASKQGRGGPSGLLDNKPLLIGGGVVAVTIICLLLYLLLGGTASQSPNNATALSPTNASSQGTAASQSGTNTGRSSNPAPAGSGQGNDVARALSAGQAAETQTERWPARLARIGLSLALAALLGAVLAFRPRRENAGPRHPEAIRSQVLIALLTSALMVVAAGDVAIALTIAGAALLIRVRPSAFEAREGTATLISAGIGLACGAARWDVALILGGFAFVVLWVLESSPQEDVARAVDLSVETRSVRETNEVLRDVFDKNHLSAEFVRVDSSDPTGRTGIVYYSINVRRSTSLDSVSEEIFAEDPDNILSVNWQQRRWPAVAYR